MVLTAEDEENVRVSVVDDGVGFDSAQPAGPAGEHIGLWSVRERLSAICGGRMELQSSPDHGTAVTLIIPKDRKEERT